MAKNTDSSIKLLVLYDILLRSTDEEHALSTNEIIEELKKRGVKKLKVVYSEEEPIRPLEDTSDNCNVEETCQENLEYKAAKRRSTPGSVAFVPSVAGLIIAGEVIKDLAKCE